VGRHHLPVFKGGTNSFNSVLQALRVEYVLGLRTVRSEAKD